MRAVSFLLNWVNGYKTYASVILAIVSGLGMILTKNYAEDVTQVFQALTLFSGAAASLACGMPCPGSQTRARST